MKNITAILFCCVLAGAVQARGEALPMEITPGPAFDIPHLGGIVIDGKGDDWGDRGFLIGAMVNHFSPINLPSISSRVRLGWDDRGLLVLADVADDVLQEQPGEKFYKGDSVELVAARQWGSPIYYYIHTSPGVDEKLPARGPRQFIQDNRPSAEVASPLVSAEIAAVKTPTGYRMEILLPWKNLGIEPRAGTETALQVYINDRDKPDDTLVKQKWFTKEWAPIDTRYMHRLRLVESGPSEPILAVATGRIDAFRTVTVDIAAARELLGKTAVLVDGDTTLASEKLASGGEGAFARITVEAPPPGKSFDSLAVRVDGKTVASVEMPNMEQARHRALYDVPLNFQTCVFSGEKFPSCDFKPKFVAEVLLGKYKKKVTFYDANFNEVTVASKPGRYGAVVEITTENGWVFRKFLTLYRLKGDINWHDAEMPMHIELLEQLGIDPAVAQEQSRQVDSCFKWAFVDGFETGSDAAIMLSGLSETRTGSPRMTGCTNPYRMNEIWWQALKKKLNLTEHRFLVHLPADYDKQPHARFPLILYLHGAGERGIDLDIVKRVGPGVYLSYHPELPFICVAAQCLPGERWNSVDVIGLLDEVLAQYRIDPDRVYLTGLSMGGFGTWYTATAYPERFAAVAPVCGGGDPDDAPRLRDVPTWVFHGDKDDVVSPELSLRMVDALTKVHGRVKLTLYPGEGHNIFMRVYKDPEFYSWLLQQTKSQPQQPETAPASVPSQKK
jgi:hypothetical protein